MSATKRSKSSRNAAWGALEAKASFDGGFFDADYYERHYEDPQGCAASADDIGVLGDFAFAYLRYLQIDVQTVLDLGCGLGHWRAVVARHAPDARYTGVELSPHVCKRFGWERGSVVDYGGEGADLVICQGVLQYLNDADATRAIETLHRLTGEALYLEVITHRDLHEACDRSRTDSNVYLRTADWYWRALEEKFIAIGGGLFLPADSEIPLFDLESLSPLLAR